MDNQDYNNEFENIETDEVVEQDELDNEFDYEIEENTEDDNETFTYSVDNNNVSSDYNYDDKKSFLYIIIGSVILIGIIALIVILVNKGDSSLNYSGIEKKMVNGAQDYYKKNEDKLPITDGGYVSITADDLIKNSYLKPFSEMVSDNVSCSGYVNVYKNGDNYAYYPYLDCGENYKSISLADKIIETDLVTSESGLYKVNDEYIFRGEYPNNYVSFDNKKWRIVKINNDKSLKLFMIYAELENEVWDDRYNSDSNSYSGINDFRISRMLEYLNKAYENNEFVSKKNMKFLIKKPWCIGKMPQNDVAISSLDLCSDVYDDLYIGLLQADDVLKSSIAPNCLNIYDGECTNYNYFSRVSNSWTLNASSVNSSNVFYIGNGFVMYKSASHEMPVRPVININPNVLFSTGDGTEDNPYVIGD